MHQHQAVDVLFLKGFQLLFASRLVTELTTLEDLITEKMPKARSIIEIDGMNNFIVSLTATRPDPI